MAMDHVAYFVAQEVRTQGRVCMRPKAFVLLRCRARSSSGADVCKDTERWPCTKFEPCGMHYQMSIKDEPRKTIKTYTHTRNLPSAPSMVGPGACTWRGGDRQGGTHHKHGDRFTAVTEHITPPVGTCEPPGTVLEAGPKQLYLLYVLYTHVHTPITYQQKPQQLNIHVYVYICVQAYVHTHVRTQMYINRNRRFVFMYTYVHTYMHPHMCTYMYIYIYIWCRVAVSIASPNGMVPPNPKP